MIFPHFLFSTTGYFLILEKVGQRLETLEEIIDDHPDTGVLEEIHAVRRELVYLRKQVWPLREIIAHLLKDDAPFISRGRTNFENDAPDKEHCGAKHDKNCHPVDD